MDSAQLNDLLFAFLSILLEGAFFIFIGTVISGFIDAYLPSKTIEKYLPKNKGMAIFMSGVLGLILPVCECAVVPVIRRLLAKGLPLSCAITYMLAAPIVNPITIFSTFSAFKEYGDIGMSVVISRVFIGYIVSVFVGFVILKTPLERVLTEGVLKTIRSGKDTEHDHSHGAPKLVQAMRTAQRDFTDIAMYFVVGVALTAYFNTQIAQSSFAGAVAGNPWTATPSLMAMAFILSLCSTSDAFIAATLQKFSYGAKLAFMVFGPMMDVKLVFLYMTVFRPKFVLLLGVGLFILIGVICGNWDNFQSPTQIPDVDPITDPTQP